MSHDRRNFLKATAGGIATVTLAGCLGGDDSVEGEITVPGMYDLSGATASVGLPTARGSEDAVAYLNDNEDLDVTINHPTTDYSYEVPEAEATYQDFTSGNTPPAILGWGTADTNLLAPRVADDEIVYISASYSPQHHQDKFPYNFFGNIDYTTQLRVLINAIEREAPDAKIGMVFVPALEFSAQNGIEYAEQRGFEVEQAELAFTASSADAQVRRMRNNNVDYIIGHTIWDPFLVLAQDVASIYPEVELMGSTWCVDERSVDEAPEVFDGVRFTNSFATFENALEADRGGEAIETAINDYQGEDAINNVDIANLHYVRGFIHTLLLFGALQNVEDEGLDPQSGADVREGMMLLDEWTNWGMSEPFNFEEGDRRGTMTGRVFEAQTDGIERVNTVELERREEWRGE